MCYAVSTKIKAMRANLLTTDALENICKTGNIPEDLGLMHDLAKILGYADKPMRDYLKRVYVPALKSSEIPALPRQKKSASLERVIGTEADLRNILWMYRLKKYHNTHGDAIFAHLSPGGHKLRPPEILRLANAKSLEDFAQIVAHSFYGKVFAEDFSRSEQKITNAIRQSFRKENETIAVVCGYLFARHLETKNLLAIAKGKAHGLSPKEIFSMLHI